ncbi:MAG TPA: hypothetical protein PKD55_00350 [Bellilinea sp.]|nr:hypothetical protein [Bellilinea sp.]
MSRYRRRTDKNQKVLVDILREVGFTISLTHTLGRGFPDLVVGGMRRDIWEPIIVLVEVKSEDGTLTPEEEEFFSQWAGYPVYCIKTPGELVVDAFGWEPGDGWSLDDAYNARLNADL